MKKQVIRNIVVIATILALQTGCNSGEQKTDNVKQEVVKATPRDTLRIYLKARKMEVTAYSFVKSGAYDSAIKQYNNCIAFLSKALADNNNTGAGLYETVLIDANEGLENIYDYLHQPENSIKCAFECLKWAKFNHDWNMQIKLDMNAAEKLKTLAENTTNDTAKKGSMGREALQYALAGARVIDSLKTNDMEDSRYNAFHLASKIYTVLGNKKQAQVYDKKYKDVYFKIYNKMPEEN